MDSQQTQGICRAGLHTAASILDDLCKLDPLDTPHSVSVWLTIRHHQQAVEFCCDVAGDVVWSEIVPFATLDAANYHGAMSKNMERDLIAGVERWRMSRG